MLQVGVEWFRLFDDSTLQDKEPACGRRFKMPPKAALRLQNCAANSGSSGAPPSNRAANSVPSDAPLNPCPPSTLVLRSISPTAHHPRPPTAPHPPSARRAPHPPPGPFLAPHLRRTGSAPAKYLRRGEAGGARKGSGGVQKVCTRGLHRVYYLRNDARKGVEQRERTR